MKYDTFYSFVELGFYSALAAHKVDYDKLDDSARKLLGLYSPAKVTIARDGSRMEIAPNALVADEQVTHAPNPYVLVVGAVWLIYSV